MNITNLDTLRRRIEDRLSDEDAVQIVKEEFDKFKVETRAMGKEPDKIGQATLSEIERAKLDTGNHIDHTPPSVIEWQCVKAAAIYYNIRNWTEKVDSSLTYEENIDRLKFLQSGDMEQAREQARLRWQDE